MWTHWVQTQWIFHECEGGINVVTDCACSEVVTVFEGCECEIVSEKERHEIFTNGTLNVARLIWSFIPIMRQWLRVWIFVLKKPLFVLSSLVSSTMSAIRSIFEVLQTVIYIPQSPVNVILWRQLCVMFVLALAVLPLSRSWTVYVLGTVLILSVGRITLTVIHVSGAKPSLSWFLVIPRIFLIVTGLSVCLVQTFCPAMFLLYSSC